MGGGFSMEPDNLLLDRYVLQHARVAHPTVCFLPTASGDADSYIVKFYAAFSTLACRPRHLSLFHQPRDLAGFVGECDVIYVGGGNTRNMLAIWRSCHLDTLLRQAWEKGTVLCGLSAGAICWFEYGHTDSAGSLDPLECLGFLPGSCTPHALHFINDQRAHVVTSRPSARALHVRSERGTVIEEPLLARFLGSRS